MNQPTILLPHSGYKNLIVYEKSDIIYQGTVLFCQRFLPRHGDRTVDQMTQAARSCKQNIAEGSAAAATSLETQLKLTNVARATLDELLEDYLDYLKANGFSEWEMNSEKKTAARNYAVSHPHWEEWKSIFETRSAAVVCNLMIVFIQQSRYLLDRMLKWQEQDFTKHGGVRERMYSARSAERAHNWETSVFSYLEKAETPIELDNRVREIQAYVSQAAWGIKQKKR